MSKKDKDELLDHNYDGIQEYDNDLPKWWVYLFLITVLWGVVYAVWFHLPSTPTPDQRLAAQMKEPDQIRAATAAKAGAGENESDLLKLTSDPATLKKGSEIFVGKCVACHAAGGAGLVGPNLTDDYWIHGGKITEIKNVVVEGVPAKGMLSWKTLMTNDEINAVVAYVWTLHGTNPPGAKAPQGDLFKR